MRDHKSIDSEMLKNTPCVAGTDIPIKSVLEFIREGLSFSKITRDHFPILTRPQIAKCVQYAIEATTAENKSHGILNSSEIEQLFRRGSQIRVIRSMLYSQIGLSDIIERVCESSTLPKTFQIILPSLDNPDFLLRASEKSRKPETTTVEIAKLAQQQKLISKLQEKYNNRHLHNIDLRTTDRPHRYHAIFSNSEAYIGLAWHAGPAMQHTSMHFPFGHNATVSVHEHLTKDFEMLWDSALAYIHVEKASRRQVLNATSAYYQAFLQQFQSRKASKIIRYLCFINERFPDVNSHGALAQDVANKFVKGLTKDASQINSELLEMEVLGLLFKVKLPGGKQRVAANLPSASQGRLVSTFGKLLVEEWRRSNPD